MYLNKSVLIRIKTGYIVLRLPHAAFPAKIIKCRYLWKKFHTIKQSIFLIFYYIEYDYIALSPDQYNFFKKRFVSYFTECKCFFLVVTSVFLFYC